MSLLVSILKRFVNKVDRIGVDLYAEGKLVIYFIKSLSFRSNELFHSLHAVMWVIASDYASLRLMRNT